MPTLTPIETRIEAVLSRIQELTPNAKAAAATQTTGFASVLATAGRGSVSTTGSAATYASQIDAAGKRYGIDPLLLQSVIQQESGFNPNATSGAGAQGLMQLMPSTASSLGVTDPYDPNQSIDGGARYLKRALDRFHGDTSLALAAYNAGEGAVLRYGGIPPYQETQNYVRSILDRYNQLTQGGRAT